MRPPPRRSLWRYLRETSLNPCATGCGSRRCRLPDRSVQSILNYRTWKTQQIPLIEIQRAPLSAPERIAERALDISIEAFAFACLLSMMLLVASAIRLGFTWSGYLPAASQGIQRPGIHHLQVPHHDGDGGRPGDRPGAQIGQPSHPAWTTPPADQHGQAAAPVRRSARRHVAGWTAAPCRCARQRISQVIANYACRHHVKPGITGWAQVNGFRGATPQLEQMANRIELDLWYINNWTLGLDMQILLRTSFDLIHRQNTY
jgi:hypothetical protein